MMHRETIGIGMGRMGSGGTGARDKSARTRWAASPPDVLRGDTRKMYPLRAITSDYSGEFFLIKGL